MKYAALPLALAATLMLFSPVAAEAQSEDDATKITDAVIEDYLNRNPESILVALNRAQERQQQAQLASLNSQVEPVAKAIIAGDPKVPFLGSKTATKVVVEFYDYNCGFCKAFHKNTQLPYLTRDKNVRFYMVQTPILGPGSQRMAELSAAAFLQGKFAAAHQFLMLRGASDAAEADGHIPDLIREAGLNEAAFRKALSDGSAKAIVTHNTELARKAGINGTPTLWFKGRTVPGNMPLADLEAGLT